jgi:hypothetical protein
MRVPEHSMFLFCGHAMLFESVGRVVALEINKVSYRYSGGPKVTNTGSFGVDPPPIQMAGAPAPALTH